MKFEFSQDIEERDSMISVHNRKLIQIGNLTIFIYNNKVLYEVLCFGIPEGDFVRVDSYLGA